MIVTVAVALPASSAWAAVSKCDAGVTKAAGKKASCKAGVYSKAQAKDEPVDLGKLTKCEDKFDAACAKAQAAGDCVVQTQPCAAVEEQVDVCVADTIDNSCGIVGGFCWLLGDTNVNCTDTCAAEGMVYDPATEAFAGSAGTDQNCTDVLDSLGVPAGPLSSGPCFISAVACYFDGGTTRTRCTTPGAEGNAYILGERACACMVAP
jgi:hypothetical protein